MIDDLNFLVQRVSYGSIGLGDVEVLVHHARGKGVAVELGTNMGGTAAMLSLCVAKVVTVDVFERLDMIDTPESNELYSQEYDANPHPYSLVKERLAPFQNVEVVQAVSYDYARQVHDRTIDFLFVDADHSYEGAKRDWIAWRPKMKRGGVVLFHDAIKPFGVWDYYRKELASDEGLEELNTHVIGITSIRAFKVLKNDRTNCDELRQPAPEPKSDEPRSNRPIAPMPSEVQVLLPQAQE